MRIIKKKNENLLINELLKILKREILKKKRKNKRISFVLTGGSSPKALYTKLSKTKIDWSNVDFFWGDERFVSKKSKYSNFNLAFNLLIKKINVRKENIFSYNVDSKNIKKSSKEYQNTIRKYFKKKPIKFDIFLLGMGVDGHIVSIFPGSKEIKEKFITKPIIRKDFKRITLSLNTINNSKKIFLWLNNKNKTNIYHRNLVKGKNIPVNNLNKKKLFCFTVN